MANTAPRSLDRRVVTFRQTWLAGSELERPNGERANLLVQGSRRPVLPEAADLGRIAAGVDEPAQRHLE